MSTKHKNKSTKLFYKTTNDMLLGLGAEKKHKKYRSKEHSIYDQSLGHSLCDFVLFTNSRSNNDF